MSVDVTVRRTVEADWQRVRDLRFEMLEDTPLAFLESLADARLHTEAQWRAAAAGRADPSGRPGAPGPPWAGRAGRPPPVPPSSRCT